MQCRRFWFDSLVGKIPWRKAWQPTPFFLPGESSWTEEPGRLQSMGSQRVGHDWATKHSTAPVHIAQCLAHNIHSIGAAEWINEWAVEWQKTEVIQVTRGVLTQSRKTLWPGEDGFLWNFLDCKTSPFTPFNLPQLLQSFLPKKCKGKTAPNVSSGTNVINIYWMFSRCQAPWEALSTPDTCYLIPMKALWSRYLTLTVEKKLQHH